jgi:hypothetical protein
MRAKPDLRAMRQAAGAGDRLAARALLKLYGLHEIAREIKADGRLSGRARNAVGALTAGTDSDWEHMESDGSITNDLQFDPPRNKAPRVGLFDDSSVSRTQ